MSGHPCRHAASRPRITGIATTAALVIWWVTIDQLARSGLDASFWAVARPLSFVSAIIGLILLTRSRSIAAALDAPPAWWLLGVQVYRFAGGLALLALWWSGRSVSALGLIAAVGDTLVGLFAVIAAAWVYSGARGGRVDVFGLSDIAFNVVNQAVLGVSVSYQVIMIAVFLAPLSVILHGLSLWQFSRARSVDSGGASKGLRAGVPSRQR